MSFEDDMEKYRNPHPYGTSEVSICWGDSYYYNLLIQEYGKERVEEYLRKNPFIRYVDNASL